MAQVTAEQVGWLPPEPSRDETPAGVLTIEVHGIPVPQGSLRAFANKKTGVPIVTSDNTRTKPWKAAVTAEASEAVARASQAEPAFGREPVGVSIVFRLPRPKGHHGRHGGLLPSAPKYPAGLPDLDKLARAVLDALTGIVWRDDAQVVALDVYKRYAGDELVTTIEVSAAR